MKRTPRTHRNRLSRSARPVFPYLVALGMAITTAQAATLTWESGSGITNPAAGTWGAANAWRDSSGAYTTWSNGSDAIFSGTGSYIVTLGAAAVTNNITFVGSNTIINPSSSGSTSAQTLTLNGTLSTSGTGNAAISANLTGTGSVVINSTGQLNLTGWNNFSGGVTLNSGTLAMAGSAVGIITGTGAGKFCPIGTGTLTINGGTIYVNAFGAGNSSLANAVVVNADFSAQSVSLSGPVDLGGVTRTITTLTGGNTLQGLGMSGVVSNGGIIVGNGLTASSVALTGTSNTFAGGVTVNSFSRLFLSGTVVGVTPAGSGTITLNASSTIGTQNNTGAIKISNAIKVNGDFTVVNNSGTFLGALDLGGAVRTITNTNNGGTAFSGKITNGGINIISAGSWAPVGVTIAGTSDSTFAEGVTVGNRGILGVSGTSIQSNGVVVSGPIGTGTLTLKNGSTLSAGQFTKIYNSINIAGDFSNTSNAGAVFYGAVALTDGNHTITQGSATAGLSLYGNITGSGGLTFTGPAASGGFTLSGTSTYTGATVVTNGAVLNVNGLLTASTTLNVNNGASLIGGNGFVNGDLTVTSGTVSNNNNSTLTLNGTNIFHGTSSVGRSGSSGSVTMTNGFTLADGVLTVNGITTTSSSNSVIAINGGLLALQSGAGLSGSSTITFGGGTMQHSALNTTDYSARIKNSSGAISVDTNGQNVTYATALASSNTGGLTKSGLGTLTLTKANAYTGATTVNKGTLELDFSATGAPTSNIIDSTSALVLGGGSLNAVGAAGASNTQTFSGLTVNSGASSVGGSNGTGGSVAISLGNITRNVGGTVDFTLPASGSVEATSGQVGTILSDHGVAYATVGGSDWAAKDASNSSIVAGSTLAGFYTANDATTVSGNADMAGGVDTMLASSASITSLRFNNAEARSLDLSGQTLTTGGILVTSTVGANASTISGGTLQGAAGQDLVIIQNNNNGALNISSTIANNTSATGLTKAGSGTLKLSQAATYTGTTAITGGTLQLSVANAIANSSLVSLENVSGVTLDLAGTTQSISALSGGGTTGGVVTSSGAAGTLVITGAGATYDGVLQDGAGLSLTMNGSGTQTLTGANTYTGVTTINSGVLSISSFAGTQTPTLTTTSGTNKAVVSSTVGLSVGMIVKANGVADGTTIAAIVNSGTITLSTAATASVTTGTASYNTPNALGEASSAATSLVINGGTLQYTGNATVTDRLFSIGTSGATLDASGVGALNLSGTGALGFNGQTGARTLTLTGANTGANTLTALIGDNGGATNLVKNGSGTWIVSGTSNTYTGTTSVNSGVLGFRGAASLGTNTSVNLGVAATSSGTLQYTGAAGTFTKNVIVQGNGGDTIQNVGGGMLTLSGAISRSSGVALTLNGGAYGIKVTGIIGGSSANSDLIINSGLAILGAANTYNGKTYINGGGLLNNGIANALPTATALYIGGTDNSCGMYDLAGYNQTIAGLYSQGNAGSDNIVANYGVANATLTVSGGGNFAGKIQDGAAATSLAVTGGNLILSGSNSYTGSTSVSSGTLSVNGSLASGNVNVSSGATLNGSGSVGKVVLVGGTLNGTLSTGAISGTGLVSAGNSPGILTATSVTSTVASGLLNFAFELATTTPNYADAAHSLNDVLHITTTNGLTLEAGTTISVYFSSLTAGAKFDGGFFVDGATTDALQGAISNATFAFYVQDALGTATFNDVKYSLLDPTQISVSAIGVTNAAFGTGTISGAELEFTVVPEPSTWAMIVGGCGLLAFSRRLRRRTSNY